LDNHLLPFFSDTKVRRGVTTEAIGRWIAYKKHLGSSDLTIKRCLVTLGAVMSYAVAINLVSQNPVARVKTIRTSDGATGVDYVLSAEQVALLINRTPKGCDRALMRMMFTTGARPSECSELRFGDCDWNAGTITISRTATKNGSNGTKNGLTRVVPMTPDLRHELQEQKRVMNAGVDDLVFPTIRGRRRDMQRFAKDILRPSLTRSGLRVPEGSAVNYLARKTFISLMISQGASPSLVALLVGSSAQQILRTYTKVRQEDTVAAMQRLAASMTTASSDTTSEFAQTA
jgi:integrase